MKKKQKRLLHFGITLGLILLGVIGWLVLTVQKPELKKIKPPAPKPVVRTINVTNGSQAVYIKGEGTVRALREIQLIPQVSGKVVSISDSLVNGGEFRKGQVLLRLDPVDYRLAVTLAQAKVKDSESKLKLAAEEAAAAREEWRLLQAQLHLERTELKAPFHGRVSQESVDLGQYVSPGQALATLYDTEAAEIIVPLENEDLSWFHVPGFTPGKGAGSPARVRARIAGQELTWTGRVVRAEGKLDARTRLVNVVVRVKNPYATKPPLAVGLFVTVEIAGRSLPNATVIPRSALRQGNVVWVVDKDNHLNFRKVEVAKRHQDEVVIQGGLKDGEEVVISPLKEVTNGMAVSPVCEADQEKR